MPSMNGKKAGRQSQRISNRSQQLILLHLKPPGGDFFLHEQAISLHPNVSAVFPKDHLNQHQIRNLQARGMIHVQEIVEPAPQPAQPAPAPVTTLPQAPRPAADGGSSN